LRKIRVFEPQIKERRLEMRRNVIKVIGKIGVFLCVLGMISGCTAMKGSAKSDKIAPGRYDIYANGLLYDEKWKEEAGKVCPKGYAIVERVKCGDTCWRGTVKCE
jgi:hypothetical protein